MHHKNLQNRRENHLLYQTVPSAVLHYIHRTPYILVVGQKEMDEGSVCVRYRFSSKKPQETMKLEDFVKYVEQKNEEKGTGI